MNRTRFERILYDFSARLGTEIYVVGIGKQIFLPYQHSSPGFVKTRIASVDLAEWVIACIENQDKLPWWTHTHPHMSAFISTIDVEGAHNLWNAIQRPYRLIVLGDDSRVEEIVDAEWIRTHPQPDWFGKHWWKKEKKRRRRSWRYGYDDDSPLYAEVPWRTREGTSRSGLDEGEGEPISVYDLWGVAGLILGDGKKVPEDEP